MRQLPLTVIGGYLGAGKTTLLNRLLAGDHGRRLTVMVNDFGSVNIDAALVQSASGDTIELTNGCVCCTMGADLFMAVGDVLDRPDWPDHLVIEASGIGDPARIANVAKAEPDLTYAGIVTVVDALNLADLLGDTQIAAQIRGQIEVADLVYVSKADPPPPEVLGALADLTTRPVLKDGTDIAPLLWALEGDAPAQSAGHAHFVHWSAPETSRLDGDALRSKLEERPAGLYRLKGFVAAPDGGGSLLQVVGQSVEIRQEPEVAVTRLVGIGVAGQVTTDEIRDWWICT